MKKARYLERKCDGVVFLRSDMRAEDGRVILVQMTGRLKKRGHCIRHRKGEFRAWLGTVGFTPDED